MDSEIWKPVVGFELSHEVSNKGRVRNIDRVITHKRGNWNFKGKPIKSLVHHSGYEIIWMSAGQIGDKPAQPGKSMLVHRLVAMAFIENPNDYKQVNHIDGNKLNNCVENLEWVTPRDNMLHSYRKGRVKQRELHNLLTTVEVLTAYCLHLYGHGRREISSMLGIPLASIDNVIKGRTFNNVTGLPKHIPVKRIA